MRHEALARQAGFRINDGEAKLCHPTPKASGLYGMLDNYAQRVREDVVRDIVARLEAGFGATSSAPLIIKREFLNETSTTG